MIPIINTNTIINGKIYLKYGYKHRDTLGPLPVLASAIKLSKPQPFLLMQKRMYTREPNGNRQLLTRKSSRSRIVELELNGWKELRTL